MKVFLKDKKEIGLRCACGETEEHLIIVDKESNKAICRKCITNKKVFKNVPEENF